LVCTKPLQRSFSTTAWNDKINVDETWSFKIKPGVRQTFTMANVIQKVGDIAGFFTQFKAIEWPFIVPLDRPIAVIVQSSHRCLSHFLLAVFGNNSAV
jgi:hypothetical protein